MMSGALTRRAEELAAQGAAFVTATVVRVQHPTSVEPGNVALVLADGAIEGFIGGVCAQHSVRLYSIRAIQDGEPMLLRILPEGPPGFSGEEDPEASREVASEPGTVTVKNPCLSGGAIEVFLEPAMPAPRVLVVGDTPIATALGRLGPELGLDTFTTEDGQRTTAQPDGGELALVVAAHGRDELAILRAGLEAGVPYVGLVASRKRGAAVIEELRADGVPSELLEALETPAGIDIGARTPAEIALTILARIVAVRRDPRAHGVAASGPGAQPAPITVVDPVCGMTIVVGGETPSLEYRGQTVYFCCTGCRDKFEAEPGRAVATS